MKPLPVEDLDFIAGHPALAWPRLADARLLIAGGTGFFGRWLVDALLAADRRHRLNLRITLISRDPRRALEKYPAWWDEEALDWLAGDLRDCPRPSPMYDYCIHAATDSSQAGQRDALGLLDQIVGGTRHLLDIARLRGVRRFLYLSSGAVYSEQPPELATLPEDWPGAPPVTDLGSAYAQGKRLAEHLCLQAARAEGFEAVIARPFACVGPGLPLDTHFAIGNFIGNALRGRPIRLQTDGRVQRSYLYTSDLTVWLFKLLLDGAAGGVYNIGSDRDLSLAELAQMVRHAVNPQAPIELGERPAAGRVRYVPDIDRARQLELAVWTPLEQAIAKTAAWYRQPS